MTPSFMALAVGKTHHLERPVSHHRVRTSNAFWDFTQCLAVGRGWLRLFLYWGLGPSAKEKSSTEAACSHVGFPRCSMCDLCAGDRELLATYGCACDYCDF